MFRYIMLSFLSLSIVFSSFNLAKANVLVYIDNANVYSKPTIKQISFNTIYPMYPDNNTYPTYYTDHTGNDNIYKYKLYEIKNERSNIMDSITSSFRILFYPFERKIPLYASVYPNNSQDE